MKVVLVVIGVCLAFEPVSTPTRSWRAAGLDVRKDRSSGAGLVVEASVPLSGLADSTVDRIDLSCEITASLRAHSSFNERLSFRVSRNFLRRTWIDSGVGVSGEE